MHLDLRSLFKITPDCFPRASQAVLVVKSPVANAVDTGEGSILGGEDLPEQEIATHSSIPAWRIPWTEEPGGLQTMGSPRDGHGWVHSTHTMYPAAPPSVCNIKQTLKTTAEKQTEKQPNLFKWSQMESAT